MQNDTKEETLKNTDVEEKIEDTKENSSQTVVDDNTNNMLIPINTGLTIFRPKFLKKVIDTRKIRLAIVYTISFLIVAFSIFQIIRINNQKNSTIQLTTSLQSYITNSTIRNEEDKVSNYKVDFEGLKKINPDTVGWIKVNGVNIDFPVVKGTDNSYYLKHSFDKSNNVCGWVFADYRNKIDGTDRNIIIYGHNRRDGTMFSNMVNILKSTWYDNEENKYITFITEDGEYTYEVFSIYQTKVEDYYIQTNFKSNDEYLKFLNTLKSRSTKDYQIDLTAEDQILTLSTCGKENKFRVVLHARKI